MSNTYIVHYHGHGAHQDPFPVLADIVASMHKLVTKVNQMSDTLADLKAAQAVVDQEMGEATTAMNTAVAKIEELAAKITAAGTDPVALKAVVDDLTAHATAMSDVTDKLAAAVAAQSTVVDTTPAPPVTTPPVTTPDPTSDTPPASEPV